MGTITAHSILTRCLILLGDASGSRWSEADVCLPFLNEGQRAIVRLKPEANIVRAVISLSAGTRQAVAVTGQTVNRMIRPIRNTNSGGTLVGAPVTTCRMDDLDAMAPGWASATASATVQDAMFTPHDPLVFWVYPPQPSQSPGYLEAEVSVYPTAIAGLTGTDYITLSDEYELALREYVIWHCYAMDIDAGSQANAEQHKSLFLSLLGVKPVAGTQQGAAA